MKLRAASVRAATVDDHAVIRRIFAATLALGRPVTVAGVTQYAAFSLDWYLDGPGAAGVHVDGGVDGGVVTGYVLVCTDEAAYDRHQRLAAARYLAALARLGLTGRLGRDARRFHRLRIEDGWALYNATPIRPADAHLHLNLLPSARADGAARRLVDHADALVAAAGHDAWYAQINTPPGRRAAGIERLGGQVIDRSPNLTLSHLVGAPVERLTVIRRLGDPAPRPGSASADGLRSVGGRTGSAAGSPSR